MASGRHPRSCSTTKANHLRGWGAKPWTLWFQRNRTARLPNGVVHTIGVQRSASPFGVARRRRVRFEVPSLRNLRGLDQRRSASHQFLWTREVSHVVSSCAVRSGFCSPGRWSDRRGIRGHARLDHRGVPRRHHDPRPERQLDVHVGRHGHRQRFVVNGRVSGKR